MPKPCLIASSALLVFSTAALAQMPGKNSEVESPAMWQEARTLLADDHQKLAVRLLSDPGHRHACRVKAVTGTSLVCKQGRGEVAYRREDIAEIVEPHTRLRPLLTVGSEFAVAGGSVTGIVLLASVSTATVVSAGIPLGVLAFVALCEGVFDIEGDCGKTIFSSAHDVVLYRNPSYAVPA